MGIVINHRPGRVNTNANALSRCPIEKMEDDGGKHLCLTFIEVGPLHEILMIHHTAEMNKLSRAQVEDTYVNS